MLLPDGEALPPWTGGYAALPFAEVESESRARVYFSGRDAHHRSSIGACTLDLQAMSVEAGSVTGQPLIAPGPPGSFDESGCTMACLLRRPEGLFLYYTGWTLGHTVPFYLTIGLAISDDGGRSFRKVPLTGPGAGSADAPLLNASPSVVVEGGRWRMWYVSGTHWERLGDGWRHHYLVRYAESEDGLVWHAAGHVAIPLQAPAEHAIGRPHVRHHQVRNDGAGYEMWFCVRGERYRLAYAESTDGLQWQRRDEAAALRPPPAAWDGEMQAYPMVFAAGGRLAMLYNGNGYGSTGFGWAAGEESEA